MLPRGGWCQLLLGGSQEPLEERAILLGGREVWGGAGGVGGGGVRVVAGRERLAFRNVKKDLNSSVWTGQPRPP